MFKRFFRSLFYTPDPLSPYEVGYRDGADMARSYPRLLAYRMATFESMAKQRRLSDHELGYYDALKEARDVGVRIPA